MSHRFPHRFNWFIYYHVTALAGRKTSLPQRRYVAAGWMQARSFKRERKSGLGGKSVHGCWYGPRKKNSCDWRRRIFWPQAGEWAEEVGSSGCIVWHLVAVGWCCVRANGVFSGRDLIGKLRNSLWLFCQNNSIRILPLCYGQKKILNFTMGKMHGSYLNLLCQTPGGGKSFLNIGHPPF